MNGDDRGVGVGGVGSGGAIEGAAERLELAVEAAEAAGRLTLELFGRARSGLGVEIKRDGTEVTAADRGAEALVRSRIAAAFPGDAVMGEEMGETPGGSGWRWIIDPIDGTFSFVRGVPLYATLIAAEWVGIEGRGEGQGRGRVEVGVIELPALGERVHAARGLGAWHTVRGSGPTRARVSRAATLGQAVVCTTSLDYFKGPAARGVFDRVCAAAGHTRGWSDAYPAALLATGRVDVLFESAIKPWDIAALEPIIAEAGGRLSDWAGAPSVYSGTLAASNGLVHEELLGVIAG